MKHTSAPSCTDRLPPHLLRAATQGDRSYIIDSWLQSYRSAPFAQRLPSDAYWSTYGHAGLVEALCERAAFVVACLPDDPTWIYGWACVEDDTLHYVHVRGQQGAFRRLGFATALLDAIGWPVRCSHMTVDYSRLTAGRKVQFVNPYAKGSR